MRNKVWVTIDDRSGYWAKRLKRGHLVKEDYDVCCPFCVYDEKMKKAAERMENKKIRSTK